jgi:UrcA family protein
MTKSRIALLGSAIAGVALLCGAGFANAQDYRHDYRSYDEHAYYDPVVGETVIVHPDYDTIYTQQRLGRINGEVNPTEYRISRPVDFSDLNLIRDVDYLELRSRVRATAQDLCAQLDERVPGLRGDRSADRDCVRDATRNAMRDVMENYHYRYG